MALALRLPLFIAIVVAGTSLPRLQSVALAAGLDAKGKAVLKQATRFYKQGMYDEAAKLLTDLVVDHPEMSSLQRNLGACYYYLRRPEPALSNLRDYLAQSKDKISAEDKQEVERWIDEMEKLRAENAIAAKVPPAAKPAPQPTAAAPAAAPPGPTWVPAPAPTPAPLAPAAGWPSPGPYSAPAPSGPSAPGGGPAAGQPYPGPPSAGRPYLGQPYYGSPTPVAGVPEPGQWPPVAAGPIRTVRQEDETHEDLRTSPGFRRGFLALPYAGWQFPIHAVSWVSSAVRVGVILGGHLSENLSLGGELAFATWEFRPWNDDHRASQFDVNAALLRHVGWSWGEFMIGPKLGWSAVLRRDDSEDAKAFINGLQIGGKIGLLITVSDSVALGVVVDLAYIRSVTDFSSASCLWDYDRSRSSYSDEQYVHEEGCNETANTVLGSLAGALLF
jgi:hypothetical protein